MSKQDIVIFWMRRDLRLEDNAAFYHALKSGYPVVPLFIYYTIILYKLENKADRRVDFIHRSLSNIKTLLDKLKVGIEIHHGIPADILIKLTDKYNLVGVYTNHDYEPYAAERDGLIEKILKERSIQFHTHKDQVIFEKDEVIKDNGDPYLIFTPYSRKWKEKLNDFYVESYPTLDLLDKLLKQPALPHPSLADMGFEKTDLISPPSQMNAEVIKLYDKQRDLPGTQGTSRLGVHLRFGTISIRQLASFAKDLSAVYLSELIWRDFYHCILWHFPRVGKGASFKPAYDHIAWRNNETEFEKWCIGETGYPIVDAGMRELNETGFMHNRVRMITASFLCKHLLIDWRWGEAYFAQKLLDFDLASNNGGWQWAAGSGCDAAPYFRIFNPYLQTKKFDAALSYINRWVPENKELSYPRPIVDHEFARKRCLEVYTKSLNAR